MELLCILKLDRYRKPSIQVVLIDIDEQYMGVKLGFEPGQPESECMNVFIYPCNYHVMKWAFPCPTTAFGGEIIVSSYFVPIGERFHSGTLGLEFTF